MAFIFSFAQSKKFAHLLSEEMGAQLGELSYRQFPDGESYVRIESNVKDKDVIIVCSLDHADTKFLSLIFLAQTAKELGAKRVGLVAPYLGYMRQDIRFKDGEAITSKIFAQLLSQHIDWLIAVDPHLHRYKKLDEIYTVPNTVVNATNPVADWVSSKVQKPVLVGPDVESAQWVQKVAEKIDAPYVVMKKVRHGDRHVEISAPDLAGYKDHTPVLVDDIISSGKTMIEAARQLTGAGLKQPIIIGVHAVFSGNAYEDLLASGAKQVVTCNTIEHVSNAIDVSSVVAVGVRDISDVH